MTKVEIIQKALEDKKATNIEVLDVAEQTSLADYFVVASCQSTVQVRACVDEIEEKLEEAGFEINHKEGYRGGSWILVTTLKLLKKNGRISGKKQVHSTLKQTAKSLSIIQ